MYEKINEDLKSAMKEKDTFKLSVLRMLKSALQLEKIAKKHELDDNEVAGVLKKQVKLRKDSLEEYEKYNKVELIDSLKKEIEILAMYLPQELSDAELEKIVDDTFMEVNPESMKDIGKVMKVVNEKLVGKNADMSKISKLVKEKLSTK